MLLKNEHWAGKVRIIGLSIDQTDEKVRNHVAENAWTKIEHYHVKNGTCRAQQEFGVQSIPKIVLVDKTGTIVYIGHPNYRTNLDLDLNTLLQGKELDSIQLEKPAKENWKIGQFSKDLIAMVLFWIFWYFVAEHFDLFKKGLF